VEAKGMELIHKEALPLSEAFILTDREKVFAILTNLVKNAIKYSEKGCIEFGYVITGGIVRPDNLTFYVKDTGIGIHKDKIEIIFDRFRQVSEGSNRNYEGVGLGLSITRAYVEMLGGKLWVESEEGIGSCFYFTLPFKTESEAATNNHKDLTSKKNEMHVADLNILIAEDDETAEWLLSMTVKPYCKSLLIARSGSQAVEICRSHPEIDLILMDIRMPDMNGYEATKQIRMFNKDVVIVAQTAYGLSCDKNNSIIAGCNEHLSKPINKDQIGELIQKYFMN
jgi:hypothetical protein